MITLLFKLDFKLFANRAIAKYFWLMALNNTSFCFKVKKTQKTPQSVKVKTQRRWISSSKTEPKENV